MKQFYLIIFLGITITVTSYILNDMKQAKEAQHGITNEFTGL